MNKYECKICGEEHNIFKAIKSPTPQRILEIKESELQQRVKKINNSFIIDDETFLLLGDIFISKKDTEEPFFIWPVWVSISLADFKSKAEELKEKKNVEFNGYLETAIPFYKKAKGLKVKTIVNISYDYAVIKIKEGSQLKKDQSEKITEKRVLEIMEFFYHPPG